MRIKAHQPFQSVEKVLEENKDIESTSTMFETEADRIMVGDTDEGKEIKEEIQMLKKLLEVLQGEIECEKDQRKVKCVFE